MSLTLTRAREEIKLALPTMALTRSTLPHSLARVADFFERYKVLYQKHLKGAHYLSHPQRDFPESPCSAKRGTTTASIAGAVS